VLAAVIGAQYWWVLAMRIHALCGWRSNMSGSITVMQQCLLHDRGAAHGHITGSGVRSFYASTIIGRLSLAAAFAAIVAVGELQTGLLVLAAVNMLGAATMAAALRRAPISYGGQRIDL